MVKKLTKYTMLSIYRKCGKELVNYKKGPGNRLLKIHRDRISKDFAGIFINNYSDEGTDILCPSCENRIATVKKIKGKYVNKVNQGQLGIVKEHKMDGKLRENIEIGLSVGIVLKKDQKQIGLQKGIVKRILTNSQRHPHGIKVELEDGKVGRIKDILN